MPGFANIKELVDAELNGQSRRYNWRKTPSQVTTSDLWFDLSMSPGNPVPKYWFDAPPLVAKAIAQSTDGGIYHGQNVAPQQQYLRLMTAIVAATGVPMPFILLDYLMYYPSCDDSVTDPQAMDNTVTLPRYSDGEGVQMMAVSVAGRTGGQRFYVTYTNQDGVTGRTSKTVYQSNAAALGTILTNNIASGISNEPFIGLQGDDTGVRAIESVTMLGGDVGLFTLILVKPIASFIVPGSDAPVEKDFFLEAGVVPEIKDDAFLGLVTVPRGSLAATVLTGDLQVVFN